MSGKSPDHSMSEGEGEDEDKRKASQEMPGPTAVGPTIPQLQCISVAHVLKKPVPLQIIDLISTSRDDAPLKPPPVVKHNGRRYYLELPTTTNDRIDVWAREDDMAAACEQLACGQGRQRQRRNSYQHDGETESALEKVKKYILSEAKVYPQELEREIPELRQAAESQGVGYFQDTPVTTKTTKTTMMMMMKKKKKKNLTPALPMPVAEENKCKHPVWNIVALMMMTRYEQQDCAICEREVEIGGHYTGCQGCSEVRCRQCEQTWLYKED